MTRIKGGESEEQPRLLLSVEQAAHALSLGRTAVFELLHRGQLRSVRIGRTRRIAVADLEAFVLDLRGVSFEDPEAALLRPLSTPAGRQYDVDPHARIDD